MRSMVSNVILPISCAIVFCGGAYAAISLSVPSASKEAVAPHDSAKNQTVKVQYSFPVFSNTQKIGHCVVVVKSPMLDPDAKFADKERIGQEYIIYNKAKIIFADVEDGTKACKELYNTVKKTVPVEEFVFLEK